MEESDQTQMNMKQSLSPMTDRYDDDDPGGGYSIYSDDRDDRRIF